jgi:hypothetical protein
MIDLDAPLQSQLAGDTVERALVVRAQRFRSYEEGIVLEASEGIAEDIDQVGTTDADSVGLWPPAGGLWIWEGVPVWTNDSRDVDGGYFFYAESGFRRATAEEARKAANGEPLWPVKDTEEPGRGPTENCDG